MDKAPSVSMDQTTGVAERLLYGLAMGALLKGVQKGWITSDEAPYYATGFVSLVGGFWAWWINRPVALAKSAANISPGTKVVTTTDVAARANDDSIVSNEMVKVTPK